MNTINESEIIQKCINGDKNAWETIYKKFSPNVRAFVSGFKFSDAETEDICQEIFIDLFKAMSSFRGESSLKTFILRISKYRCISIFRNLSAQKRGGGEHTLSLAQTDSMDEEEEGIVIKDKRMTAEELMIKQEESSELIEAIEKLSDDCQKIIKKRYFADLSYLLLAKEFDMPLGTLCSKLKRCLTYLKRIYPSKVN